MTSPRLTLVIAASAIAVGVACSGPSDDACSDRLLQEQKKAAIAVVHTIDQALPRMQEQFGKAVHGINMTGQGFFKQADRLERRAERLENALSVGCQ